MAFVETLQQSVSSLNAQHTATSNYNGNHLTKSVHLIQVYHSDEMRVCRFIVIDCDQHL